MPIASIVFLVETTTHARAGFAFHGLFYGLRNFRCKTAHFCATRRESETTETPGVSNAAQASKNARKNSVLNYKSAALPTELCRHFARGNATFSSNFRPHCIRNFLWDASWRHEHGAKSKTKLRTSSLLRGAPPNNMLHQLYSL
jgi:hypothetical protein